VIKIKFSRRREFIRIVIEIRSLFIKLTYRKPLNDANLGMYLRFYKICIYMMETMPFLRLLSTELFYYAHSPIFRKLSKEIL